MLLTNNLAQFTVKSVHVRMQEMSKFHSHLHIGLSPAITWVSQPVLQGTTEHSRKFANSRMPENGDALQIKLADAPDCLTALTANVQV